MIIDSFGVKTIVFNQTNSSVGVMKKKKKKKKKKKMEKIEVRPISVYNCSGIFYLLWECRWVQNHSQTMIIYLKRLKSSNFVRVKAFPMYGGIGVSAPSLHRESTDSLIMQNQYSLYMCNIQASGLLPATMETV